MASKNKSFIVDVLIKHIKSYKCLYKSFDFSHKQQKYNLSDYLIEILIFDDHNNINTLCL